MLLGERKILRKSQYVNMSWQVNRHMPASHFLLPCYSGHNCAAGMLKSTFSYSSIAAEVMLTCKSGEDADTVTVAADMGAAAVKLSTPNIAAKSDLL